MSERVSAAELSPERPERVTLLLARTAVEVLAELLLRVALPELLLRTAPSLPDELLRTVVPELEALLLERVLEELALALLLERVPVAEELLLELRVTCWLLPLEAERELEVLALLLERVACWLLPLLEERVTC